MSGRRWVFRAVMLALAAAIAFGGYLLYRRWIVVGWRTNALYTPLGARLSPHAGRLRLMTDPLTGYRNFPEQEHPYRVDQRGFRPTSADTTGALAYVLGGSTAFGHSVFADSLTFAALLDRRLTGYHVRNAGVVGFLSGQELALMVHRLDADRPALYIVVDGWNDMFCPYVVTEKWPARLSFGVNNNIDRMAATLAGYIADDPRTTPELLSIPSPVAPVDVEGCLRRGRETYTANLERMAAFASARGARLLVVFQPEASVRPGLLEDEAKVAGTRLWQVYARKGGPHHYAELVAAARAFCEERGIPSLDLLTDPRWTEGSEPLFVDPVHPNARGHALIAEGIARKLEELGW